MSFGREKLDIDQVASSYIVCEAPLVYDVNDTDTDSDTEELAEEN